jgi:hypothetical protein
MSMKRRIALLASLGSVLLLSACGGEPSESDIQAALQAEVSKGNDMAQVMLGHPPREEMQTKVVSAKKVSCAEAKPGWNCTVNMVVRVPIFGEQSSTTTFQFVKGDKGWVVAQ